MSAKKFSPFYTNNLSKNFNRTMNRLYELIEYDTYNKEKTIFEAKILTGDATDSDTDGFFDNISSKLFGDTLSRGYKIRFINKDKDYNSFPSPYDYSGEERINIISLHPFAYLFADLEISGELPNNTAVVVELIDDVYVITEILDTIEESPERKSIEGAKDSWTTGGKKKTKAELDSDKPPPDDSPETSDTTEAPEVSKKPKYGAGSVIKSLVVNKNTGIIMIGDSQFQATTMGGSTIGGWLDKHLKETYGRQMVQRLAQRSTTPKYWNQSQRRAKIEKAIAKINDKTENELNDLLFIILLAGNISPERLEPETKKAKELITFLKKKAERVSIIWIGAPPPASDGTRYNRDGKLLEKRKNINNYLESNVSADVNTFINSTKVSGYETEYKCGKTCDGLHMPGQIALSFLIAANLSEEQK